MIQHFDPRQHDKALAKDLGTPAPAADATPVSVEIDGVEITVPEGTSVLRAAALADINIPKLCATDSLEAFGSCRLCAVQVEGRRGTPAACTTPVAEGMKVTLRLDEGPDGAGPIHPCDGMAHGKKNGEILSPGERQGSQQNLLDQRRGHQQRGQPEGQRQHHQSRPTRSPPQTTKRSRQLSQPGPHRVPTPNPPTWSSWPWHCPSPARSSRSRCSRSRTPRGPCTGAPRSASWWCRTSSPWS